MSESHDELAVLRELILSPERAELDSLKERLENPEVHAQDVSRVLAEAIILRARDDDELTAALQPIFLDAMRVAVKHEPRLVADVIYPVIGPAIRKAVASALRDFTRNLNATVSQVFSLRGLRWRWQAWRTGKPLAEIAMRNSLSYRVEQVFLIHRVSGLLLCHVSLPEVDTEDPAMVGAMLSAITEYTRDSFGAGADQAVSSFEVGELVVWVEEGPHAAIAAVVRGIAPLELRNAMQDALERIHRELSAQLEGFAGDTTAFAAAAHELDTCLLVA